MIATDRLSIDDVRRGLGATTVGRQLHLLDEVDSTNAVLRRLARGGAQDGTVVLAESQTAGRGRRGQAWFSPTGVNLYASVLFRPRVPVRDVPVFALAASVALVEMMKRFGVESGIKWPNDVLVGGKKVAGTLVESALRGDDVEYVILGVGVNVNVDVTTLHAALGGAGAFATSLAAALGHEVDRSAVAAAYLGELDRWTGRFRIEGPEVLRRAWREREIMSGRRVEVRGAGTRFEGRVLGLDPAGCLVVQDTLARRHAITSEEVRILD